MSRSFSLGVRKIWDELAVMQAPGFYWVNIERQVDANLFCQQLIRSQPENTRAALICSGQKPENLLSNVAHSGPCKLPLFTLPAQKNALKYLTHDLMRSLRPQQRLFILFAPANLWQTFTSEEMQQWLQHIQQWLEAQNCTLLVICHSTGINKIKNQLVSQHRYLQGLANLQWQQDNAQYVVSWWSTAKGVTANQLVLLEADEQGWSMADVRLLRASCGQSSHKDLYQPQDQQCYLFDNLAKLGFTSQLMMDHSGVFGNYLQNIQDDGNMRAPMMSQKGISNQLASFDGEPIYNDLELLNRWLEQQKNGGDTRSATFMNIIPLHDGNRFVGTNKTADYRSRAQTLFDQLNTFLEELEKSGRKVMVVVVPEHGAALVGDKMQMSGLRDIPSPSITHIPVGIKLIGMKAPQPASPVVVSAPSSYLAISELVSRMVDGKVFTTPSVDWQTLTQGLPETAVISENDNAIVMQYQGKPYIRLNGGDWVPYPQ